MQIFLTVIPFILPYNIFEVSQISYNIFYEKEKETEIMREAHTKTKNQWLIEYRTTIWLDDTFNVDKSYMIIITTIRCDLFSCYLVSILSLYIEHWTNKLFSLRRWMAHIACTVFSFLFLLQRRFVCHRHIVNK